MFASWYDDRPMLVKQLIQHTYNAGIAKPWHYNVVILNLSGTLANNKMETNFDQHVDLARTFYHSEFPAAEGDEISFTNAAVLDVTVMILRFRPGKNEDPKKVFKGSMVERKAAVAIAAVTY